MTICYYVKEPDDGELEQSNLLSDDDGSNDGSENEGYGDGEDEPAMAPKKTFVC